MKESLDKIIEELKEIRTITRTKVSDEILFEQAVKLFISDKIQNNQKKKGDNKPTDKQLAFIKKHNIKIKEGLNKEEAKEIISEYIESNK
jgi:hypothetical protein